jgi:hypothetical protein
MSAFLNPPTTKRKINTKKTLFFRDGSEKDEHLETRAPVDTDQQERQALKQGTQFIHRRWIKVRLSSLTEQPMDTIEM